MPPPCPPPPATCGMSSKARLPPPLDCCQRILGFAVGASCERVPHTLFASSHFNASVRRASSRARIVPSRNGDGGKGAPGRRPWGTPPPIVLPATGPGQEEVPLA